MAVCQLMCEFKCFGRIKEGNCLFKKDYPFNFFKYTWYGNVIHTKGRGRDHLYNKDVEWSDITEWVNQNTPTATITENVKSYLEFTMTNFFTGNVIHTISFSDEDFVFFKLAWEGYISIE